MFNDDDDENTFDFSQVGLLGRQPRAGAQPILDRVLGKEDTVPVSPQDAMHRGVVKDPKPMRCDQATMECLRGPCRHLWNQTVRVPSHGEDRIHIGRARQCNAYAGEAEELADENVFECTLWWPRPLAFIPESLWTILRVPTRWLWEFVLKKRGYDFSWKWWSDDTFEARDDAPAFGRLPRKRKPEGKNVIQPEPGTTIFNV